MLLSGIGHSTAALPPKRISQLQLFSFYYFSRTRQDANNLRNNSTLRLQSLGLQTDGLSFPSLSSFASVISGQVLNRCDRASPLIHVTLEFRRAFRISSHELSYVEEH